MQFACLKERESDRCAVRLCRGDVGSNLAMHQTPTTMLFWILAVGCRLESDAGVRLYSLSSWASSSSFVDTPTALEGAKELLQGETWRINLREGRLGKRPEEAGLAGRGREGQGSGIEAVAPCLKSNDAKVERLVRALGRASDGTAAAVAEEQVERVAEGGGRRAAVSSEQRGLGLEDGSKVEEQTHRRERERIVEEARLKLV
jgi:hypothetical protein